MRRLVSVAILSLVIQGLTLAPVQAKDRVVVRPAKSYWQTGRTHRAFSDPITALYNPVGGREIRERGKVVGRQSNVLPLAALLEGQKLAAYPERNRGKVMERTFTLRERIAELFERSGRPTSQALVKLAPDAFDLGRVRQTITFTANDFDIQTRKAIAYQVDVRLDLRGQPHASNLRLAPQQNN